MVNFNIFTQNFNTLNFSDSESDFNKTLPPWIGRTYKVINIYISDVFHKNNIQVTKEQWIVLKILHEDNHKIIQNDLAFITNRNKASLARLINVLEKNKLVTRKPSKEDSRKNFIYITKKGEQLFLKMKPLMLRSIEIIQEGVTQNEKKIFIKVMKKIQKNIQQQTV